MIDAPVEQASIQVSSDRVEQPNPFTVAQKEQSPSVANQTESLPGGATTITELPQQVDDSAAKETAIEKLREAIAANQESGEPPTTETPMPEYSEPSVANASEKISIPEQTVHSAQSEAPTQRISSKPQESKRNLFSGFNLGKAQEVLKNIFSIPGKVARFVGSKLLQFWTGASSVKPPLAPPQAA